MIVLDERWTRRRVITILAASAALPLAGSAGKAGGPEPYRWQGIALGAKADLTLYAASRGEAATAIDAALAEMARLEAIFSLHQPGSALVRLNRDGLLVDPPVELQALLSQALELSDLSGGCFDPTIQPLWRLLADHFAKPGADPAGPPAAMLAAARALVDHRGVIVAADRIALARPGMQVSLNGIAQGYVSDRVAGLLQARGFGPALVNLGEILALGRKPDGSGWRIGLAAPGVAAQSVEEVEITVGAVATSAARGLLFDASGRFNHIIDPTRLACAARDRSVSVLAPTAATADGLSTLAALLPDPERDLPRHLARFGARAYLRSGPQAPGVWLG
ncbi:MAG TPA: FAD:protein FMN transferase [Alphaproteobacteria bacterium]|nr:FAD:protein FMN transferase [Alphaproteobacteria bacterium]